MSASNYDCWAAEVGQSFSYLGKHCKTRSNRQSKHFRPRWSQHGSIECFVDCPIVFSAMLARSQPWASVSMNRPASHTINQHEFLFIDRVSWPHVSFDACRTEATYCTIPDCHDRSFTIADCSVTIHYCVILQLSVSWKITKVSRDFSLIIMYGIHWWRREINILTTESQSFTTSILACLVHTVEIWWDVLVDDHDYVYTVLERKSSRAQLERQAIRGQHETAREDSGLPLCRLIMRKARKHEAEANECR